MTAIRKEVTVKRTQRSMSRTTWTWFPTHVVAKANEDITQIHK